MEKSRIAIIVVIVIALFGLILFIRQAGNSPSEQASTDASLETARTHLEAGAYGDAIAELEAIIARDPKNSQAHFLLGQAYNQTNDLLKAMDEFRTVIELDPENAAAHHNLGVTYFQLQDPNAAVAEFNAALQLDPDDPDTHYQLGATYLVLALVGADPSASANPQLLQQAVESFEAALTLKEGMPEALIGLGNVYIQQGEYDTAIETLQTAIETRPQSPEAHYALGEAYAQKGDMANACETFGQFMDLNPPQAWRTQAQQTMTMLGCP
ncbi:MAG TPA: tetratricopeptide repeat protein [Chloroflexi bacterium]|mgnify:CR=1 FL=1|nr:tetratricopeptide repeat protein [Chloroflexota bacterium]